jgi:RNA recognition motif-containing protein
MEQFGPVDYAVLCKAAIKDITQDEDEATKKVNKKPDQLLGTHKGTGFVRFKNNADAKTLLELSLNLEKQLNQEREKKDRLSKTKDSDKALLSSASLLKGELELNGRRLVVMSSVSRNKVDSVVKDNKDAAKGLGEDRRNLLLKKEGLLNEKLWINSSPLTAKDLEQR